MHLNLERGNCSGWYRRAKPFTTCQRLKPRVHERWKALTANRGEGLVGVLDGPRRLLECSSAQLNGERKQRGFSFAPSVMKLHVKSDDAILLGTPTVARVRCPGRVGSTGERLAPDDRSYLELYMF